ncbi:hypothetical protein A2cp1_1125 [Anaeromyxobacter dehalogenans 2CP-1]|uniref:DUF1573 domain-containing protein n=1 Tax=Anaeromyxobacter dehalogenans (strain ATCC BAA-258 / DSM 21875 / 2CP-1) TaxID=455488 RepID=B8JFN2_ANAD2|nr:hypothetical protein [Anaeromyxobacter dehalogenans]ACL64470.1 hypothetical protein A2cp1_1125 [Anaeromyxobacter dehalogenans 2CP-1]
MARVWTLVQCTVALAMLGGAPRALAKGAAQEAGVKGVRQIVLDEKTVGKAIAIRTARNLLTTVEFPEDMLGAPSCGDCTDGKNPDSDALFRVEPVAQGRYLAITPNGDAGRRTKPGEEPVTTVLVRLEHTTLMLYLERVERKSAADTRVVLVYPNRSGESEYVRAEKAKLEAESATRIESEVSGRFLRAFSEPHHCSKKGARARNDDVVLEVTELCYFGREVILSFTVENRGRIPVEIGSVIVNKGASKREYLSERTIEFQKVSSGVVSLRLPEGDTTGGPFELTVSEGSGKRRAVTVGGLDF